MNNFEKIKKMILIALGFALATYLMMSGMAMLDAEDTTISQEKLIKKY